MLYLPDTNVWIRELNNAQSVVQKRFRATHRDDIALCDVVKAELYFGAFKSSRVQENLAGLARLFGTFQCLPFNSEAARVYGKLRADLTRSGTPIGPLDLQIASIALLNGCILVSHNTREFSRIVGLQIEDWEA